MRKKIFQLFLSIYIIFSPLLILPNVNATSDADFGVSTQTDIEYVPGKTFVNVEETVTFSVKNQKYFLQPGAVHYFYLGDYLNENIKEERAFKLKSVDLKNIYEIPVEYKVIEEKSGITLKVVINEKIVPYSDYSLTLKYKTHDLININGNITNIYVPGLAQDVKFTTVGRYNLKTEYNYNVRVITPKEFSLPSYTQPGSIKRTQDAISNYYSIDGKSLVGHMAWLQFGTKQYYKFKLVQEAVKTDNIIPKGISDIVPILSTNIYKIAIPREYSETGQSISISSIVPKPKSYERDFDGNLIAHFEVPANQQTKIEITGYISLAKKDITMQKELKDMNLAEYNEKIKTLPDLSTYTQSDTYWESNDPFVNDIAKNLLSKSSSILELIENDYNYIVNKFEYSYNKLASGNIRLGGKAALSGSQTICMEYSDALTAILRSQGIPTRIAIGYGNDPKSQENKISNTTLLKQTIGHQWTQVWIPNYGWLSLDPTWGESGRKYIGSDLDHILWYTSSSSKQAISDSVFYSSTIKEIGNYEVSLQALTQSQFDEQSKDSTPISQLNIVAQSQQLPIDFYIKTSAVGKALVFMIPIAATVVISALITTIIYAIKRKVKKA